MTVSKISLNQIHRLETQAIQSLTEELTQQGFAILTTEGYTEASIIQRTLEHSRQMTTFPGHMYQKSNVEIS